MMRNKHGRMLLTALFLVLYCTKCKGATLRSIVRKRPIAREDKSQFQWVSSHVEGPDNRKQHLSKKKSGHGVEDTENGSRSHLRARRRYRQHVSDLSGLSSLETMKSMGKKGRLVRSRKRYRQFTEEQVEQSYEELGSNAVPLPNNELLNEGEWLVAMGNAERSVEYHMELLYKHLTSSMSELGDSLLTV